MVFVDTLYVIALTNRRDQYHDRAGRLAEEYESAQLITTDAVLLEIGNALARGFKDAAIAVIERFLSADNLRIARLTPELFERAFDLYRSHRDKEWGLIDCVSFVVMRDEGVTDALTVDQHFIQAGFRALMWDDA